MCNVCFECRIRGASTSFPTSVFSVLRADARLAAFAVCVAIVAGCTAPEARTPVDQPVSAPSGGVVIDSAAGVAADTVITPPASLVDSLADVIVYGPTNQEWFLAAVRAKRLLMDIGRIDASLRVKGSKEIDSIRARAFREAVARKAHVKIGDVFRLRGQWGADDATVTGYDWWNGRIVARLSLPPRVDSLARLRDNLVASAHRAMVKTPSVSDTCNRTKVDSAIAVRADIVRDSLTTILKNDTLRLPLKARASLRATSARISGCFGAARVLVIANARSERNEYVFERAALIDSLGRAHPVRIVDYRFRAHDPILSFDADGDGVDDLAARGLAGGAGATTILRLVEGRRLERLTGGFVWEGQ